jgi:hypothetical protein
LLSIFNLRHYTMAAPLWAGAQALVGRRWLL